MVGDDRGNLRVFSKNKSLLFDTDWESSVFSKEITNVVLQKVKIESTFPVARPSTDSLEKGRSFLK